MKVTLPHPPSIQQSPQSASDTGRNTQPGKVLPGGGSQLARDMPLDLESVPLDLESVQTFLSDTKHMLFDLSRPQLPILRGKGS